MSDIQIRAATDSDIPGIVALIRDRIGEEDAPEALLVLEDAGFDRRRWSVAVDGDRVVSTMATFPMTIRFGICTLPGSQIEFVATDKAYEGRRLIRRQFEYHHTDLEARGELLQVIVGITYFYRRLGYEYALRVADSRTLPTGQIPTMPDGWAVREAGVDDLDTVIQLQAPVQDAASLAVGLSAELWSFILRSPVYTTLVAERHGAPAACGRLYIYEGEPMVMDLAASTKEGITAVLADVAVRAPGHAVPFLDRSGIRSITTDLGEAEASGDSYYARIGDPVAFLNAVRPELSRRLAESSLAEAEGTGLISLYTSSIHFSYAGGEISPFTHGAGEQAPISKGGSGVAPDHFVALVVGHRGISGLEHLHPDVNAGAQRELMQILFPPQTSDIQSWVVP